MATFPGQEEEDERGDVINNRESQERGRSLCVAASAAMVGGWGHMTERSEGAGAAPAAAGKHKHRAAAWLVARDNRRDVSGGKCAFAWLLWQRKQARPGANCVSPADQRGDDDAPGGAAAVGAGRLRVHVAVRGVLALAPPAAQPEGVEEEEEEVQGQAQQRHGAEQQDGLWRHTHTHTNESNTQFQPAFSSGFHINSAGMLKSRAPRGVGANSGSG